MPSARGGRKPTKEIDVELVRELTEDDLEDLFEAPKESPGGAIKALRDSHHSLARALAQGMSSEEAQIATGYSGSYISILKSDPTFQSLLSHYQAQKDREFADVNERTKIVGLDALSLLQERLVDKPESWSNRELMELMDRTLGKAPGGAGQSGGAASAPPTFNIQFVGGDSGAGLVIDEGGGKPPSLGDDNSTVFSRGFLPSPEGEQ